MNGLMDDCTINMVTFVLDFKGFVWKIFEKHKSTFVNMIWFEQLTTKFTQALRNMMCSTILYKSFSKSVACTGNVVHSTRGCNWAGLY